MSSVKMELYLIILYYFFTGLGWGMVIISLLVAIYFNVILAWTLFYIGSSFTKRLPWGHCDNDFNSESKYIRSNCHVFEEYPGYFLLNFIDLTFVVTNQVLGKNWVNFSDVWLVNHLLLLIKFQEKTGLVSLMSDWLIICCTQSNFRKN